MRSIYTFLLTGFGAGWLPLAPGTWGAAAALVPAWLLALWMPAYFEPVLLVLIAGGTWIGARGSAFMAAEWGGDPSQTVLDEIVGMWIAILFVPATWPWWLTAFLLFRLFDIFKPFGIRRLESVPNGWGVMLDDVLAGIYSNIILQVALLIWL